ncbi:MAG: UbiA prenyltransferase family protein [Nanoarchaeota archaeon]
MELMQYFTLIRVKQYYKNVLVFLAIFFSGNLFNLDILARSIAGFFILCAASSSIYVFNDIVDRKSDKIHPEKSKRPLASGSIKTKNASILSVSLMLASLSLSYIISKQFFFIVLFLMFFSFIYTLWMSKILIMDILFISINFVLRAVSGGSLNNIWVSPWLISGSFFLAFFLAAGKRKSELVYMESLKKKKTFYPEKILDRMLYFSATMLLGSYILYTISANLWLLVTVPFASHMAFKYLKYSSLGFRSARNHEYLFFDRNIAVSLSIYLFLLTSVLYWKNIISLF